MFIITIYNKRTGDVINFNKEFHTVDDALYYLNSKSPRNDIIKRLKGYRCGYKDINIDDYDIYINEIKHVIEVGVIDRKFTEYNPCFN